MPSYRIYHSCLRKIRYRTKKRAMNALKQIKKEGYMVPRNAMAYHCENCNGWHLGHDRKKEKV